MTDAAAQNIQHSRRGPEADPVYRLRASRSHTVGCKPSRTKRSMPPRIDHLLITAMACSLTHACWLPLNSGADVCKPGTLGAAPDDKALFLREINVAVETALASPPPPGYRPIPKNVRLLGISYADKNSIVFNFSEELLANGTGADLEDVAHQILQAVSNLASQHEITNFRILVNGLPLEQLLQ